MKQIIPKLFYYEQSIQQIKIINEIVIIIVMIKTAEKTHFH